MCSFSLLGFRRLREEEDEVIYTETDCISGLPLFRGDLVVKTTYRVTRDKDDPDNSVHVKVYWYNILAYVPEMSDEL